MTTKLQEIHEKLPVRSATPSAWISTVLSNIPKFLADHASCERKASAGALMLVHRFPEFPNVQDRLIELAREELEHYHQVFQILKSKKLPLIPDEPDLYVAKLLKFVRHPQDEHLMDRLLATAVVEARSCERFCLFANALPEGDLKDFYVQFAIAESAHVPLFVNLAKSIFNETSVEKRWAEWLDIEATCIAEVPFSARVH